MELWATEYFQMKLATLPIGMAHAMRRAGETGARIGTGVGAAGGTAGYVAAHHANLIPPSLDTLPSILLSAGGSGAVGGNIGRRVGQRIGAINYKLNRPGAGSQINAGNIPSAGEGQGTF